MIIIQKIQKKKKKIDDYFQIHLLLNSPPRLIENKWIVIVFVIY